MCQNQHFWGPEIRAHRSVSKFPNLELFWPISSNISLFSQFLTPKKSQNSKVFWKKSLFFERIRPRDPSQMKDLKILHPNHCSTAPETLMRPTWWQKTVKNLKLYFFQTVFPLLSYQDDFLATWDPSQMKDLKIPHRIHLSTALYDRIWPTLCRFKVPNFSFFFPHFLYFFKISCFFHNPLSPTSFALLDITRGQMGNTIYQMGNTIYLLFLY